MSTVLYDHFRGNVRCLLTEYGWSQSDLADAMGCTQSYVSQVLTGYRTPGLDVVQKFADALGVDALKLLAENLGKK